MDWREWMVRQVPAWAAQLASWVVLVAGWAAFAPDSERAPGLLLLVSALLLIPVVLRGVRLVWWRLWGWLAAFVLAVFVTGFIGSFVLWLAVATVLTVPAAYWLVDRAWDRGDVTERWRRRSAEDGG
jgi:hypothetical protein